MAWRDSVTVHRAILSFNFFFFNDTATTEIYPLSLHDALPISKTRAELIDESLAILEGLWSGEPFAFEGHYFQFGPMRSEEHTSELQSRPHLVCRLLLEKKKGVLARPSPA